MAVWGSNVLAIVLLIVAGYLVHICLTELQLSFLQGVLVFPFGLLEYFTRGQKLGFNP